MIKNNIKIAFRTFGKYKLTSFINILGLALGIACVSLAYVFIKHELSYDKFYANDQQIYRIYQELEDFTYRGKNTVAYTTVGLAPALVEDFPEVNHATTIRDHEACRLCCHKLGLSIKKRKTPIDF